MGQEAKVETERNITAYFAHEVRNPLHSVDCALSSMPTDVPEETKKHIDAMRQCISFMSTVMNNLLDIRKMEEGMMKLNSNPISLKTLLKKCHTMLFPSVRPGVDFKTKFNLQKNEW